MSVFDWTTRMTAPWLGWNDLLRRCLVSFSISAIMSFALWVWSCQPVPVTLSLVGSSIGIQATAWDGALFLEAFDPANYNEAKGVRLIQGSEFSKRQIAVWNPFAFSSARDSWGNPGWSLQFRIWFVFQLSGLLFPLLFLPARALVRFQRRLRNRCPRCCYNLRGNESGICPECGQPAPHAYPAAP